MRFLCKEKLEKLPGKLENSGKTESAFFVMDMHNYFFSLLVIKSSVIGCHRTLRSFVFLRWLSDR
jgi:hypothetical protein